jgi:predicted esterase
MNDPLHMLETPSGIKFGSLGKPKAELAPSIIVIGSDLEYSLTNDEMNEVGRLLGPKGIKSYGLDVPCHGADLKPGEQQGLNGWRARLDQDEDFVTPFTQKVSEIIDFLIAEGFSDPHQIAIAGTSRGGFMGLHAMAAEPRVRCGVAFAPVTELPILNEFWGLEKHSLTQSLSLSNVADKLAGRPLWMCIGNNDERVGTDSLIAFSRKVVSSSFAQKRSAPIELHVMPSEGHRIHEAAHEEAAAWLSKNLVHPLKKT